MKNTLLLLMLYVPFLVNAQSRTLSGKVSDKATALPIGRVNVMVYVEETNKLVKFGTTGEDGRFAIQLAEKLTAPMYVRFSCIGYETCKKRLEEGKDMEVFLSPQDIEIKEVVVKAPRVRLQGDTIKYDVQLYSKEGDRAIGDVLKRLPGIKTSEDGKISYNGVPINRFYIENSNLLGTQYGIATNNIPQKDVASVEVMQNHQPIKVLEGLVFSDQAAINLRLKSGARMKWIGTLKAAGGIGDGEGLWNGEGTAMRFSKGFQTLNTLKSNNTGQDISKELNSFNRNEIINAPNLLREYIDITPPYSLGLSRERELQNRTHQVTSHNLFKLKSGQDIKFSLTYQNHREKTLKKTQSVYYDPAGNEQWRMDEVEDGNFHKNVLNGKVSTEINRSDYNLTENLDVTLDWKDRDVRLGGYQSNSQNMYEGGKKLANDLFLMKRNGKKFVNFASYLLYQSQPQRLSVSREESAVMQRIRPSEFFTDNSVSWGAVSGLFTFDFKSSLGGMFRKFESDSYGLEAANVAERNNMKMGFVKAGFSPEMKYQDEKLVATLSFPLDYYHYRSEADNSTLRHDKLSWQTSLYAEYRLNSRLKIQARGDYRENPVSLSGFYPGSVLTTYRTLTEGLTDFFHTVDASVGGGIEYNIPLSEFFSSIRFRKSWNRSPYTVSQRMQDQYILSGYVDVPQKANTTNLDFSVTKATGWAKAKFTLEGGWSRRDAFLFRSEGKVESRQDNFTLSPEIDMNVLSWMNVNYRMRFSHTRFHISDSEEKEKTYQLQQKLSVRFLPSEKWSFTVCGEHFANKISQTDTRHFFLGDIQATYKATKRLHIDFHLNNLFNEKEYAYTTFLPDATKISRSYTIRPRNIMVGAYILF